MIVQRATNLLLPPGNRRLQVLTACWSENLKPVFECFSSP